MCYTRGKVVSDQFDYLKVFVNRETTILLLYCRQYTGDSQCPLWEGSRTDDFLNNKFNILLPFFSCLGVVCCVFKNHF